MLGKKGPRVKISTRYRRLLVGLPTVLELFCLLASFSAFTVLVRYANAQQWVNLDNSWVLEIGTYPLTQPTTFPRCRLRSQRMQLIGCRYDNVMSSIPYILYTFLEQSHLRRAGLPFLLIYM